MRRPREVIRRVPGGFIVDVEGNGESVETTEVVASIILRIWPNVAMQIAKAWRPPSPDSRTVQVISADGVVEREVVE